jgi:hypothetical protein
MLMAERQSIFGPSVDAAVFDLDELMPRTEPARDQFFG